MDCTVSRKPAGFEPITVSITLKTRAEADAFFHLTNHSSTVSEAVKERNKLANAGDMYSLLFGIGYSFRDGIGHMPGKPSPFRVLA